MTTTAPQGRPLAAELSLAMIEQALLDRFPSNVPTIDVSSAATAARRPSGRRRALRSATSPRRTRSSQLLAERERLETEARRPGH